MVPVDPLLDEVDAATGRMTFYSVGELGSEAESFEVSAEIEGGEVIPELSWDFAVPDAKAVAKARKAGQPLHCITVTHRVVFRATSSAPTLTFIDWAGRTERGGAVGGRQLVNFVRVAPYYGGL